jgi:hypothetical protein
VGAPAGAQAITAATSYDPSGAASVTQPAPKIIITPSPGLPSGATLQVKLDRTKVTGKKGLQFTGSDTQMVTTLPFAASASLMAGDVITADVAVQVVFTNAPGMTVADHIQLTSGGMPVMIDVKPDASGDPRKVTVAPKTMWLPGTTYTLSVDKDTADLFGVKVAEAVMVTFTIKDPNAEAGAPDAGAGDAGADTAVSPDAGEDVAAPADAGADAAPADAADDGPAGG